MKKYFILALLLFTHFLAFAQEAENTDTETKEILEVSKNSNKPTSPGDWRDKQNNGIGFGLMVSNGLGAQLFYDYNLGPQEQVHIQFAADSTTESTLFQTDVILISRSLISASYRRFFSKNSGWYTGVGAGLMSASFNYNYTDSSLNDNFEWVDTDYEYAAEGGGLYALIEIGYQGYKGYYFHIGFQPAVLLSYSDDYDESKVADITNHRSTSTLAWEGAKTVSMLELGFGWFF